MSIIYDDKTKEKLYTDIFRVTLNHLPVLTDKQSKQLPKIIKQTIRHVQYGRSRDFTIVDLALCLYWALSENYIDSWPAQPYLERVKEQIEMSVPDKEPVETLRDYWTKAK